MDNNAVWFGFKKADETYSLSDLIRSYLVYIILVTIHAVIILRQTIKRLNLGLPSYTPAVLFQRINRDDADRDIIHLIKYCFNFAFYKFGVEVIIIRLLEPMHHLCSNIIWVYFRYV